VSVEVRDIWNWLPAFLAVAETGAVVEAARELHLTPAAVSRTLRLLEEAMGEQLFNRVGRSLVLNTRGAALRDSVRSAKSALDRGLAILEEDPFLGNLRISSIGVVGDEFVMPALIDLKREHPSVVPEHLNLRVREANTALQRGEIDIAFYYEGLSVDEISVVRLGTLSMSVYCGKEHPLFSAKRVTRNKLLEHEFSVPQMGDSGRIMDGWPADLQRKIGMRITLLRSNLRVSRSGVLLTVLPDVTAAPGVAAGELRRLSAVELPEIEVFYAVHHSQLQTKAISAVIDAVRVRLASCPSASLEGGQGAVHQQRA
jgi:DNA-binding transcriptional LysR family regulator